MSTAINPWHSTTTRRHKSSSFVRAEADGFYVDRSLKTGSLIANEVILRELIRFLRSHFEHNRRGSLLDVGAGTRPYAAVYEEYFDNCISVDVPTSEHPIHVDSFACANELPFQDGTYDCLVCTEVLEHVPDPRATLLEFHRVLVPGGVAFLTTPFLVPLHEVPFDFFRYTPFALRKMSKEAGFFIESITSRGDYFAVLLSNLTFPLQKFWGLASLITRVRLSRSNNPFVWMGIVLPQLLYLRYWQTSRNDATLCGRIYKRLDYITLGYVTVLRKPA